jgi:hypothetical protein
MARAGKADAAALFARAGLEGLPARVFRAESRPTAQALAQAVGPGPLMVRTATTDEARNLPRIAGVDAAAAASWIRALPAGLEVIVQPYAQVVYSAEMAVYDDGQMLAEIIAGIWELDAQAVPVTVLARRGEPEIQVTWPAEPQVARFHSLGAGYEWRPVAAQDWQVSEVVAWFQDHPTGLQAVADAYGCPAGIKLHHAAGYGLSPQNVRTDVPVLPSAAGSTGTSATSGGRAEPPPAFVVLDDVAGLLEASSVPDGQLVLDVSLAREDHPVLDRLIGRLQQAGVRVVWLRSGLLSHLAITLREAGMEVRRADERLLRR